MKVQKISISQAARRIIKARNLGIEMVEVPGGKFIFGTRSKARKINLPTFYISRTTITDAQYEVFRKATGHNPPHDCIESSSNLPVVGVSYYDAWAFAMWVKAEIPSTLQWEKAARGPEGLIYPFGNKMDLNKIAPAGKLSPVDRKSVEDGASPYGVWDIVGNVEEWVDSRHPNPKWANTTACLINLHPSGLKNMGVARGGSFLYSSGFDQSLRCDFHPAVQDLEDTYPSSYSVNRGFRIVMS